MLLTIKALSDFLIDNNLLAEAQQLFKIAQQLSQEEEEELAWEEFNQIKEQRAEELEQEKEYFFDRDVYPKPPEPIKSLDEIPIEEYNWLLGETQSHWNRIRQYINEEFVKKNHKILQKILQTHNTRSPVYLGSGEYGVAWQLDDGNILKIMRAGGIENYNSGLSALFSEDSLKPIQEAMIHSRGTFKPAKPNNKAPIIFLEWVVMEGFITGEKIFKNSPGVAIEFSDLVSISVSIVMRAIKNLHPDQTNRYRILNLSPTNPEFKNMASMIFNEVRKIFLQEPKPTRDIVKIIKKVKDAADRGQYLLANDWYPKLLEQIITKVISGRSDLHSNNLGLREVPGWHPGSDQASGYFIFFDF